MAKVGYFEVQVEDLKRAQEFYRNVFGGRSQSSMCLSNTICLTRAIKVKKVSMVAC